MYIRVYTKDNCPACRMTKRWLDDHDVQYVQIKLADANGNPVDEEAKAKIDNRLGSNENLISAQGYFRRAVGEDVYETYDQNGYKVSPGVINKLVQNTADEYINEYRGQ